MSTPTEKITDNRIPAFARESIQKQSEGKATFQFMDNRSGAIAQRKLQVLANNSPQVNQMKVFQEMASSRLNAKKMYKEAINPNAPGTKVMHPKTTVQLMSSRNARQKIAQSRNNRKRLLAVLLVIAANIIAGDFVLEDVDDLLENGEDREFLVDQITKQQQKAERRAQKQQTKFNAKAQFGRQNNNRGGGRNHKGR